MTVARTQDQIKSRVDDFLWREKSMPIQRLREILDRHFRRFSQVAIVGGLVRDLARRGKVGFKSDIDLVVDGRAADVAELAMVLSAKPNRFGGFSSFHPLWRIDFWSLENTWAATHRYAQVHTVQDIIKTTFFDCDAICYEIGTRRVHSLPDYLSRLQARTIDINLRPNPSIESNLLRAARRILLWGFRPGPALRDFIEQELNDYRFRVICATDIETYAEPIVRAFGTALELKQALLADRISNPFNTSAGEQLNLPGLIGPLE